MFIKKVGMTIVYFGVGFIFDYLCFLRFEMYEKVKKFKTKRIL